MQKIQTSQAGSATPADTAMRQLLGLFELQQLAADHYLGESLDLGFRNLFGGHILGQALRAAGNTCEDRSVHSLHAYFIRGGDPRQPIHYKVERIRDGNSFSVRRVTASQENKTILTLASSFQIEEDGFAHQATMPEVPPPESLTIHRDSTREMAQGDDDQITSDRAIEIRHVDPLDHLHPEIRPPSQCTWFRAVGAVAGKQPLHRCLLAYASDFGLMATCMRPHGVTYYQPTMVTASLDHAMWFYQDVRVDEWLLYVCESPAAAHGRGINHGNIFRRDGTLVACVAQEGLFRQARLQA
jgi:acyl-CoA thioesterase-2